MAPTYGYSGDPADSDLDAVRFYAQDTNQSRWLLSNEEYEHLLDQWMPIYGSTLYVAAVACEIIAAKYAGFPDIAADGVTVSLGSLSDRYNALAGSLRDQYKAAGQSAGPWDADVMAGVGAGAHDPSIPALVFGIGFQDNFSAGKQNYGDRSYTDYVVIPEEAPGV